MNTTLSKTYDDGRAGSLVSTITLPLKMRGTTVENIGPNQYKARCPVCQWVFEELDANKERYLTVTAHADRVELSCEKGCSTKNICEALDLDEAALITCPEETASVNELEAAFDEGDTAIDLRDAIEVAPAYLIEDIVVKGFATNLYGGPGHGKTLAAVAMACHIATGKPFLGKATRQGRILILDYELNEGIQKRQAAKIFNGLGVEFPEGMIFYRAPKVPLRQILPALKREIAAKRIDLVIVDSFTRATTDIDASPQAVCGLYEELEATGTFLMLDHQAKDSQFAPYEKQSEYGTMQKRGAARSSWQIQKVSARDGHMTLKLTRHKNTFGPSGGELQATVSFADDAITFRAQATGKPKKKKLPEWIVEAVKTLGQPTAEELAAWVNERRDKQTTVGSIKAKLPGLVKRGQLAVVDMSERPTVTNRVRKSNGLVTHAAISPAQTARGVTKQKVTPPCVSAPLTCQNAPRYRYSAAYISINTFLFVMCS